MLYTVLCCFLILGTQVALPWKVTSYNQRQVHDGEGIEQAHNSWNTLKFLNDPEIIPWNCNKMTMNYLLLLAHFLP